MVFVVPREDRATTIFAVDFPEEDALFARIACQEFGDMRQVTSVFER